MQIPLVFLKEVQPIAVRVRGRPIRETAVEVSLKPIRNAVGIGIRGEWKIERRRRRVLEDREGDLIQSATERILLPHAVKFPLREPKAIALQRRHER